MVASIRTVARHKRAGPLWPRIVRHRVGDRMLWTRLLQRLKRAHVRQRFGRQQEDLRSRFLCELAASPAGAGMTWHEVEWITDPVIFVRQDRVEPHYALVGVSAVRSRHEEPPETQAGTAVFRYADGAWTTAGQLLCNLTPSEALEKLMHQFLQPVG